VAKDAAEASMDADWAAWVSQKVKDGAHQLMAEYEWNARSAELNAMSVRGRLAAADAWLGWCQQDVKHTKGITWDCSFDCIAAIGALQRSNQSAYLDWLPIMEALEAGAWLFWVTHEEIRVS